MRCRVWPGACAEWQRKPKRRTAPADELTQEDKRQNVIRLAFGGSEERYQEFIDTVRDAVPPGTCVVLRGSAVTGVRWKDNAPFDADGPGTSDLDLTLVGGDEVVGLYKVTGFLRPRHPLASTE